MSNIFITDIVGAGVYAVPTSDAELALATAGLNSRLASVSGLSYDRVLAWVEDSGGPGVVEGARTLNCLIEKFTVSGAECPSESDVDALIAAIEFNLELDADITSVGNQQVHIFQAGAYFLWNRDISGGFLYPNVPTDAVAVGSYAAPTGMWFADGDLVIGGSAMVGTEFLRVIGDTRIEGQLSIIDDKLVMSNDATTPPWNMTERAAGQATPASGDIYLNDGTLFGNGSGVPGFQRWTGAAWEDVSGTPLAARGDILVRNASNVTAALPIGGASTVLTSDGADVSWEAASAGITGVVMSIETGRYDYSSPAGSGPEEVVGQFMFDASKAPGTVKFRCMLNPTLTAGDQVEVHIDDIGAPGTPAAPTRVTDTTTYGMVVAAADAEQAYKETAALTLTGGPSPGTLVAGPRMYEVVITVTGGNGAGTADVGFAGLYVEV